MCVVRKKRFLLLYGTQKGQSQAIAEEIGQQADRHGFVADIVSLQDLDKFSLEEEKDPVLFVISTTGNGEPPEPAAKFVREIQNRELPADYLAHLRYGLLALGDSEFTFFCNGGKIVDRRLQELGAKHFYDTGCADDSIGLELVVDPWIEGLWAALNREYMKRTDHPEKTEEMKNMIGDQNVQNVPENLDLRMKEIKLNVSPTPSATSPNDDTSDTSTEAAPSLVRSVPPLCQCSLTVPSLPVPYLDVHILDCDRKNWSPSAHAFIHLYSVFWGLYLLSWFAVWALASQLPLQALLGVMVNTGQSPHFLLHILDAPAPEEWSCSTKRVGLT